MSRRGNCYDDAPAGSFWSRLKIKLLDGVSFRNPAEARLEISQYLAYHKAELLADSSFLNLAEAKLEIGCPVAYYNVENRCLVIPRPQSLQNLPANNPISVPESSSECGDQ